MSAQNVEMVGLEWTAAGQVITYTSERPNNWCREGWAISDEHARFLDTYWQSMGDAHMLTEAELATAEHRFWLDDYRELDRHGHATPNEWAKYAPADRQRVTSQHGLQARYFVRHGAEFDLPTQIENASEALDQSDRELRSAQVRRLDAESKLRALQTRLDALTRPGATS